MKQNPAVIVASQVVKSYRVDDEIDSPPVLNGVSLIARPGEMVAIVGPSGSGKSTLLYCLAGLEQVDSGSVELLGTDLGAASARHIALMRRRLVGFVFQSFNLVPSMTATENVALPLILAGESDRTCRHRARTILRSVGLAEFEKRPPRRMSGGQQQRVALARVFAQSPRVVFADEPTGALDHRTGVMVIDTLASLAREGACVVLVTHDLDAAARADRALVLIDGRAVAEVTGPTPEILLHSLHLAPAGGE